MGSNNPLTQSSSCFQCSLLITKKREYKNVNLSTVSERSLQRSPFKAKIVMVAQAGKHAFEPALRGSFHTL